MRQRGFGLLVDAPSLLPGLRPAESSALPDLTVTLEPTLDTSLLAGDAWHTSRARSESGEPTLQIHAPTAATGDCWRFRFGDATTFLVSTAGDRVRCAWREPLTLEDTVTYLLGPILGFVLRLRGTTALHASAVEIDGRAVAFAADGGMGKSTTAAAFARAGYRVLTDDVCALLRRGDDVLVQPSYPRVRLWPESVAHLYDDADAVPPLTPNWDKRGLDLDEASHRSEPAPLAHVFLLAYTDDEGTPDIQPAPGQAALLQLVRHVYGHGFSDETMRARDFDLLADVVARVPVSWLRLRDDLAALDEVVEAVARHVRKDAQANEEDRR